ncbi:hypothetical protein [Brachybacterium hainanense]|uniref:Uncharacterized protein n=1 Tax=Brachybacterium hainanense TaxID=1541174 RepID=A0ABV6R958_9MICO
MTRKTIRIAEGRLELHAQPDGHVLVRFRHPLPQGFSPATSVPAAVERARASLRMDGWTVEEGSESLARAIRAALAVGPVPAPAEATDAAHATDWQAIAEQHESTIETLQDELDRVRTDLDSWLNLTPRDLLDQAWEAAHVPEDGMIPAGSVYITHAEKVGIYVCASEGSPIPAEDDSQGIERRLLDPPPPRPDWMDEAERIQEILTDLGDAGFRHDPVLLSRHIAERLAEGVRVGGGEG